MKVAILCGGQGTRLREETGDRPKPMVTVGEEPILWHVMKIYAHYGHRDFVLGLGYLGDRIRDYFLGYDARNDDVTVTLGPGGGVTCHQARPRESFRVTLVDTGPRTMTGGRIKRLGRYLDEPIFLATYADGLADIDLAQLLAFHRQHGKLATVTTVRPVSRYGLLEVDAGGRVTRFAEKPRETGWINAGFFVFGCKFLEYLGGDDCVLEQEPLERLAREGQLMAYRHAGFFFAMDTYRERTLLNEMWERGEAPWKIWKPADSGAADRSS